MMLVEETRKPYTTYASYANSTVGNGSVLHLSLASVQIDRRKFSRPLAIISKKYTIRSQRQFRDDKSNEAWNLLPNKFHLTEPVSPFRCTKSLALIWQRFTAFFTALCDARSESRFVGCLTSVTFV